MHIHDVFIKMMSFAVLSVPCKIKCRVTNRKQNIVQGVALTLRYFHLLVCVTLGDIPSLIA
jgi:hypothetical protein